MTDKEIKRLSKRVKSILTPSLNINYSIAHSHPSGFAGCWSRSHDTRNDNIDYFSSELYDASDEEVLNVIVHEHVHALLGNIHNISFIQTPKSINKLLQIELEISVSELTKILMPLFLPMLNKKGE